MCSGTERVDGRLLVIGYGNSLRGDDGAGRAAAERVERLLACDAVSVLSVHQLTPELAEPISRAGRVVFVDACVETAPGTVTWRRLEARPSALAINHSASAESLLAMAGQLYGRVPEAFMVGIGAARLDAVEGLSPVVERAVEEVVGAVQQMAAEGFVEAADA
jgi:hydrogenase maturation protease